ncbi:hypothetical protein IX39_03275 [Chryseobacterium formosense]|uniref:Uncharacterized protein n=1 Tax=Chryseobacterium formosense TaxID=236814 RepID=A0A085Z5I7_9FLAO|nr:hypothetical protein [Chryseobacterium formosense]KFE99700.1 hypothetical protein IX39_03275 [Chryseobacterium formosense]SFT71175.1 hypothetical protein SAMN05421857_2620 [Chryseobacterium formosense]
MDRPSRNTPIFKKAEEIYKALKTITDLIPEDNEYLKDVKMNLLGDSMVMMAKISGAEAVKLYDIKMENAAIIRKAARDILVGGNTLEMFGFEDAKYYTIVRDLVEEFKILFAEWVEGFNPKHFIVDGWGLFNPPGISRDYIQRDDELNFLYEDDDE